MKQTENEFSITLRNLTDKIGELDSMNVFISDRYFRVHVCGEKSCETLEIPREKFELYG